MSRIAVNSREVSMTHETRQMPNRFLTRRSFVAGVTALTGAAFLGSPESARAHADLPRTRDLAFRSLHTGESLEVSYVDDGRLLPDAMASINHIMRDWRTGDLYDMDVELLDMLFVLRGRLESTTPFSIISAYRSPATNGKLAANSNGVARRSLHMRGMAIDVNLEGRRLQDLHREALAMGSGGVGLYSASGFIHLDTGRTRRWGH
jgi:uncharacterized protein YcbK (DUF882 family)